MIVFLDKQFNKSVPREKRKVCQAKLSQLLSAAEEGREREFLNQNNAKPMRGTEYIWKFRATDADRIIYIHTKDVPHMADRYPDSILLLRYTGHDQQGTVAENLDLHALKAEKVKPYQTDFRFTDATTDEEAQNYLRTMLVHRIDASQLEAYMDAVESDYDVVLSEEQADILGRMEFPLVLYGCAGSGKTILSAHILFQQMFIQPDHRGFYTSLSSQLIRQIRKLYHNICVAETGDTGISGQADLLDIVSWMQHQLNWEPRKLIQFEHFENQFCGETADPAVRYQLNVLARQHIAPLDIWAEIRGILKGHLDECWEWNQPIPSSSLSDQGIRWLRNGGYIEAEDDTFKTYRKAQGHAGRPILPLVQKELDGEISLSENSRNKICHDARLIDLHFAEFDPQKTALSETEYLSLSEEYSIYHPAARHEIYSFFLAYQQWLTQNGCYDDNDMARSLILSPSRETYDFIVADEVQDLTEMQIYALFCSCRHPGNMVFSGDIHQVINPTYYSEDRIKKLYYMHADQLSVQIETLKKNYRSQDKIVNLANALSEIRKWRIGSRSQLSELSEESVIEGWNPMQLEVSGDNLKQMVNTVNELPYAAVITPDTHSADHLIELLDGEYSGSFYTIQEIKGLEKRYVFCYNIVSAYSSAWADIFSDADIKKNIKYRYYFNTLYVAITRSQNYLCFYEDRIPANMQPWVNSFTDSISAFDAETMFLSDNEHAGRHWYESARRCEENGDYRRAAIQYKKSEFEDYLSCVNRCNVRVLLSENKPREAMQYCFRTNAYELLQLVAKLSRDDELARICGELHRFMTSDDPQCQMENLLRDISALGLDDDFPAVIADRMIDLTWMKIESLTERVNKNIAEMKSNG